MKIQQRNWTPFSGWELVHNSDFSYDNSLVFAFGDRYELENKERYHELRKFYPNANIIMNSTAGEIIGEHVQDGSIVSTAIHFEKTTYKMVEANGENFDDSYDLGKHLVDRLDKTDLSHIFVISDGGIINGSELVKGMNEHIPDTVAVTGGLAADGPRFERTLVGWNNPPSVGNVIAIGLYGDNLHIGFGSLGGWDTFGLKRTITKADKNVLYELDGKSALELYKRYLGDKAAELPGSALLFPLSIQLNKEDKPLVRTILSIDEENQSMIFAGDMPIGATAQLMKANFDKLVDGAYGAASSGQDLLKGAKAEIALLISCVGRKLVLDQRIEEEIESVTEVIGEDIPKFGFYSNGEIAPFAGLMNCELHNQTMTITLMGES